MKSAEAVTLISALIAASVVVIGYYANQYATRRERRARLYADALEALADHEELPYLIWRRASLDGAVLTERISRGHGRLRYYETLLQLDSGVDEHRNGKSRQAAFSRNGWIFDLT